MNKILNFIIKNTGSHSYKEVFEIIDDLLINKQITLDTIIKKKDQNEISLKDFIIEFYKENLFDVDVVNFINKYGININFDNEDSYLSLMKFLNKCLVSNKDEIDSSWNNFKEKNPSGEGIVDYLNNWNLNNMDSFFQLIFENNPSNVAFIFKEVINNYLGFENIQNIFRSFISNKSLFYPDLEGMINLLNENPYLINFRDKREKTVIENIFLKYPDKILNNVEMNENTKKELIDLYFKRNFENQEPVIIKDISKNPNIETFLSKEDWFKTIYEGKDIVSELVKEEDKKGIIEIAFEKDDKFKNYLLERKENLLIEYLSCNFNFSLKGYAFLEKGLPSLLKRENNEHGVLDVLLNGSNTIFYKNNSFLNLLGSLPYPMLLTSSSKNLLNWIDNIPFYNMSISPLHNNAKKESFDKLFHLALTSLDNVFNKNMNIEVKEARDKLILQCKIKELFIMPTFEPFEKSKIIELIENSDLSGRVLMDFKVIKNLVNEGYIDDNFIKMRISEEEKELINKEILIKNDINRIKKRI